MTHSSDLTPAYTVTDADIVAIDVADGKIAYGPLGKIVGIFGAITADQVRLLLHMNGSDASTTFTDNSVSPHTVTAANDAQIDTADSKFGGASGLFDGAGDYLSIPYVSADFDWFNSSYTVECWVKAASWTNWQNAAGQSALIGRMSITSASTYWSFGPINGGTLRFYFYKGSGVEIDSTGTLPTNEWVHIAMTYSIGSGEIKLFINGVLDGSGNISGTPQSATYDLIIGQANNQSITGWVDDLRILQGLAKYTADFTPPTAQHPDL